MRPLAFALSLCACSSTEAPSHSDATPTACQNLRSDLQTAADQSRTSPNAVLAARTSDCGTVVVVSGDPSTATVDSLFRMGSVTKTFVAAVILTLAADGKLSLDDPLSRWVAGIAGQKGITLRMLLNHTSGLFNYTDDFTFGTDPSRMWSPRELVDLAVSHPAYFAPGADFHYSNTNYILLGMAAEIAGGASIGDLVRKRAVGPAALAHTYFAGEEAVGGTMAHGFARSHHDVTDLDDPSGSWASGAMVASAGDLADWVAALYGGSRVLDDDQRAMLTADEQNNYGLGVEMIPESATAGAGPGVGHGGAMVGFYTSAFYFPRLHMSLVSLVNQDGSDSNALLSAGLRVVVPQLPAN